MQLANRLKALQKNVFAQMDQAKAQSAASGHKIIDLSLGSLDLSPPKSVITTIEKSLYDPSNYGYLLYHGTKNFRETVAHWYTKKFGIPVNPETEVLQLIGSQEGTAHLPLAILNPGDYALLGNPCYPSHPGGVYLAGGKPYYMPLLAENDFLPIFGDIPNEIIQKARLMILNYPHNPTTAVASLDFFQEAVVFCKENNITLIHDFPYGDIVFEENYISPSIFQVDTKKDISIELFSFSKSYAMGGFRIAYAIGNATLIQALKQVKSNIDFNQYKGILAGAMTALNGSQECLKETVNILKNRRDVFVKALNDIGWEIPLPKATMYVWAKLPPPWENNSMDFCTKLVANTGVAAAPGSGFGSSGEGYIRFALVRDTEILTEAVEKIALFMGKNS